MVKEVTLVPVPMSQWDIWKYSFSLNMHFINLPEKSELLVSSFDLRPTTEPLCKSRFSCLGDKVTQWRNGILPKKGSASWKLTYLMPCWVFEYRSQMFSDARPTFTDWSCPHEFYPASQEQVHCVSPAVPPRPPREQWAFSPSFSYKLKILGVTIHKYIFHVYWQHLPSQKTRRLIALVLSACYSTIFTSSLPVVSLLKLLQLGVDFC